MTTNSNEIGRKLRRLRKIRQISLTKLAQETGMSYSYLSGLENGKHSITISNLQRLAEYFDIDLLNFLDTKNDDGAIFIGKEDRECFLTEDGVSFKVITSETAKKLQVTLVELPPYSPAERHIHNHGDGEEFLTVLNGKLFVMVGEDKYELQEGDAVFFNSSLEHVMYTEDKKARFFLIVSPPYGRRIVPGKHEANEKKE